MLNTLPYRTQSSSLRFATCPSLQVCQLTRSMIAQRHVMYDGTVVNYSFFEPRRNFGRKIIHQDLAILFTKVCQDEWMNKSSVKIPCLVCAYKTNLNNKSTTLLLTKQRGFCQMTITSKQLLVERVRRGTCLLVESSQLNFFHKQILLYVSRKSIGLLSPPWIFDLFIVSNTKLTDISIYNFNMLTATDEPVQMDWTADETASLKDSEYCAGSISTQHTVPRPLGPEALPLNPVDRLMEYLSSNVPDSELNSLLISHLLGLTPPISEQSLRLIANLPNAIVKAICPTDRWTLLANSIRLMDKIPKSNSQLYYSTISKYLLALGRELTLGLQQMDILVEQLGKVRTEKIVTGEGCRIHPESIVLMKIIQGCVGREDDWNKLSADFQQVKTLIRRIFSGLANQLNCKNKREYLHKMLKDCFVLSSSIEYPMAMTFITIANSELLTYFLNCTEENRDKPSFMPILGLSIEKILSFCSTLPVIQFQEVACHKEDCVVCDICKCSSTRLLTFYLINNASSASTQSQFNICNGCSLYAPSSRNFLLNLLPLILGTYHNNFQPQQLRQSKSILLLNWVEDLKNKSRQRQLEALLERLQKTPIREKVKFFDTQCLAYMNFHSENIGLKYQLKNLFAYWVIELNADGYLRRVRGLREAHSLLQVYDNQDMAEYREKIVKVLNIRVFDKHESVRAEALKVAELFYNKAQQQQYLSMLIQGLSDSNLKIRKTLLTFFESRIRTSRNFTLPPSLIIKLAQLTLDPYQHISKLATNCIAKCILNGQAEKRLAQLLENEVIAKNRELLKTIIDCCVKGQEGFEKKGVERLLKRILSSDNISSDSHFKCFLEVLSQSSPQTLQTHLQKIMDLCSSNPSSCSILTILNNIVNAKRKYTHRQSSYLSNLIGSLEKNVFTQSQPLVKASLPLLVKFNIAFQNESNLMEIVSKCKMYLSYILSKQEISEQEKQHAQRSMMIVSMISVGLNEMGNANPENSQLLVACYEQLMGIANSSHSILKPKAMECLCLFWKHDHRFLYFSEDCLSNLTLDTSTALLLFSSFLDRLLQYPSHILPASTLTTITNLFLHAYPQHLSSPSASLRLTIVRLIGQLISFGLVSPFDMAPISLCFMCDPEEEVRNSAEHVVRKLDNRFLLKDFRRTAKEIVTSIVGWYGEIVPAVGRDDGNGSFFQRLVCGERVTSKKKLPTGSKEKGQTGKNSITFVKKLGELVTSCEDITSSESRSLLQFVCQVLNCTGEFEKFDLMEIASSLNTSIQVNYRGIMKKLKEQAKRQRDDSQEEQSCQSSNSIVATGRILLKMLCTLDRLTSHRPTNAFLKDIEGSSLQYIELGYNESGNEEQVGLGTQELYRTIKDFWESRTSRTNRFKKAAPEPSNRKNRETKGSRELSRSYTKSVKNKKLAKSAPKTSLVQDTKDAIEENSYRKKLRGGRPKKYKYVLEE